MTRKTWLMIATAALLGGLSLYLNRDWFAKDNIHIYSRSRPLRAGAQRRNAEPQKTLPITFGFSRQLKLTEVKVIPVSALATNKYPRPVWHLISESNSVPLREVMYGWPVPGMHPKVKGATAYPLEPATPYRLFIQAQDFAGQHDFTPQAKPQ